MTPLRHSDDRATTPSQAWPLVVLSMESWTEVQRRVRIMTELLVEIDEGVDVLYVAPALDVPFEIRQRHFSALRAKRHRRIHPRIHVLRPRKWWPRRLGNVADRSLARQVERQIRRLGFRHPVIWINDASYADYALASGRPTLYDITDDWLQMPGDDRPRLRLKDQDERLVAEASEVVVCSPDLARTRGGKRPVVLLSNGVDVDRFQGDHARPADLPAGAVATYVGSLHDARFDVDLVVDLAMSDPELAVVLVGPNHLEPESTAKLTRHDNIHVLGARPYASVPAYMQHSDLIVVPHPVNAFTESLDPIKAYECLASGRPTVATPVAGFRDLGAPVVVADRDDFVARVHATLADGRRPERKDDPTAPGPTSPIPTWRDRTLQLAAIFERLRRGRPSAGSAP